EKLGVRLQPFVDEEAVEIELTAVFELEAEEIGSPADMPLDLGLDDLDPPLPRLLEHRLRHPMGPAVGEDRDLIREILRAVGRLVDLVAAAHQGHMPVDVEMAVAADADVPPLGVAGVAE